MDIYFTDYFKVTKKELANYGAFNCSLLFDLPLFIDPFLLFNSKQKKYRVLHNEMINYLRFLKDKSINNNLPEGLLKAWFTFPEVSQNWFGYSKTNNKGRGLGPGFARDLNENLHFIFKNFGNNTKIASGNHLEKLYILNKGVGKDRISDFTTNLIKKYLLEYTHSFAIQFIDTSLLEERTVRKVEFNYDTETWSSKTYLLPIYQNDFVILTPKNLLSKDDTWINSKDLIRDFHNTIESIPNDQLREQINNYFNKILPAKATTEDTKKAKIKTLHKYQELIDYYIRYKEDTGEEASLQSQKKVLYSNEVFVENVKSIIEDIFAKTKFYETNFSTTEETRSRLLFFKNIIENNDGYKLFYFNNKPIANESDVQLLFRFVWHATLSDVNREPNNGRGPVDFKISMGSNDNTLVEFKLARSSSLKRNLQNQVSIYKKANNTKKAFTVIVYFDDDEYAKVNMILRELNLQQSDDIILIDAGKKISASKA